MTLGPVMVDLEGTQLQPAEREMLATVDRKALARGVAGVLVVLGLIGAATWFMVVGR